MACVGACCGLPDYYTRAYQLERRQRSHSLEMSSSLSEYANKVYNTDRTVGVYPHHDVGVYDEDLRNEKREMWYVILFILATLALFCGAGTRYPAESPSLPRWWSSHFSLPM